MTDFFFVPARQNKGQSQSLNTTPALAMRLPSSWSPDLKPCFANSFFFIVTGHLTHPSLQYLEVDGEHVLCVSCLM